MTRIFLIRKSTVYFAVIFNMLSIVLRFLENSAVINFSEGKKREREGKKKQFIFIVLNFKQIYSIIYLLLLKVAASFNQEKKRLQLQF